MAGLEQRVTETLRMVNGATFESRTQTQTDVFLNASMAALAETLRMVNGQLPPNKKAKT